MQVPTRTHISSITSWHILLCFVFYNIGFGQNQTNNWYFGNNAGLNFNNGTVSVLNDGSMDTPAGCSAISDNLGNLLFYTNGQTVWNKNHDIMTNGSGLPGEVRNTQTSIIIPKPNDENTYYIFTTRVNPTTTAPLLSKGLFLSQIEFNAANPLGIVTVKGQRISPGSSERITAVYDPPSNTFRLIAFANVPISGGSSGRFYVFTISENGVDLTPNISVVDPAKSDVGAMKASPDGKFVAFADHDDQRVNVYNYDVANNSFSLFNTIPAFLPFVNVYPYGVEFSPDSKIIYFTGKITNSTSFIFKFVLISDAPQPLPEKVTIAYSDDYDFGSMQLAIDGKIYVSTFKNENDIITPLKHLSVIHDPEDAIANSGFQPEAIHLESGESVKGLPNFVPSFFKNRIITENTCLNEAFNFSLESYSPISSVLWEFGDGNTSTDFSPNYQYSSSGDFTVKATITINGIQIPLFKNITVYPLPILTPGQTLYQCDLDNDNTSNFNLYTIQDKNTGAEIEDMKFYHSYNDALNDTDAITNPEVFENSSNPQQIFTRIWTPKGCNIISDFFIETRQAVLQPISTMYACESSDGILNNFEGTFDLRTKGDEIRIEQNISSTSEITFYASYLDAQTKTNALALYFDSPSTTIWVRVDDDDIACQGIGSIELIVNSNLEFDIEDAYILCEATATTSFTLDGGATNDSWEWRDGNDNIISNNREYTFTEAGTYSLTAYKEENNVKCASTKEFTISNSGVPEFETIETNVTEIFVEVTGDSSYEFSLDGVIYFGEGTTHTFQNVLPGVHTIYVKDRNDCERTISKDVSFIGFPKHFSPNGDRYNDTWKVLGVNEDLYTYANIEIYDRYGKMLYKMGTKENEEGWNGIYNGQRMRSSDYWFKATLVNNKGEVLHKSGHFSLVH